MKMGSVFGASQGNEEAALRDYLAQIPPSQHQGVIEALMQRGGETARMIGGGMASLFEGGGMLNPTPAPFEPSMQGVMDAGNFAADMVNPAPGIDRSIQAFGEGRYVDAAAEGMAAIPMMATFAGRGAKTADLAALSRAEDMAASGAPREAIWSDTGWFKGVDGQWRFEIDDASSRMTQDADMFDLDFPVDGRFREVLDHPALADAYGMGNRTKVNRSSVMSGAYDVQRGDISANAPSLDDARSVLLHESQHSIQAREGFTGGGNPHTLLDFHDGDPETLIFNDYIRRSKEAGFEPTPDDRQAFMKSAQYEIYKRQAGETEARNVQTRRDFTPEQRRAQAPWQTQDMPDELQIVRKR